MHIVLQCDINEGSISLGSTNPSPNEQLPVLLRVIRVTYEFLRMRCMEHICYLTTDQSLALLSATDNLSPDFGTVFCLQA